jgi:hypothetical protein
MSLSTLQNAVEATREMPVTWLFTDRSLNVATPFTAFTVVVPLRVTDAAYVPLRTTDTGPL